MKTNTKPERPRTHGGAPARHITPEQELRRSVLACLLWEKQFYEDGEDIADRIERLVAQVPVDSVLALAQEARSVHGLRHVPLLMLSALAAYRLDSLAATIERVVSRPDELGELIALYWRNGKRPIPAQMKKGLAEAIKKFDRYQLAKYKGKRNAITLRDVIRLVHPKPVDDEQAQLWGEVVNDTLGAADTWEAGLSAGADKRETFERLLREGKLGYMALLRNLRNMTEVGVDEKMIKSALRARRGAHRVLPFRYVAAARACPALEPVIDEALCAAINEMPPLPGKTQVLVDVSASMRVYLSDRSELSRMDAAAALAAMIPGEVELWTFSTRSVQVPPRRGMAGVDAILSSQHHGSTQLAEAVREANRRHHDRLIVITDEQSTSWRPVPDPVAERAYMINVGSYENGVGYGKWTHIDGFSEAVLKWIMELEA